MSVARSVALLALLPLLSGCTIARSYTGTPIRGEVSRIVPGVSTRSDVLREFGPPTRIVHQTTGDAFEYTYQRWNFSSLQLRDPITGTTWFTYRRSFEDRDRLLVVFDFQGVVRDVAWDQRTHQLPPL